MCGIAGALAFGAAQAGRADAQLTCMAHRGPDAEGVFERGPGWVGQTRLAVIDLPHGDPPIANETGTVGVSLNGEIYNFRELRAGLSARGHTLRTDGDTEVIAHLAEELEPVALASALEGMFALAAWDEPRGRLVLARDRFGKKPLYYFRDGRRLVFGSEIKSVLAHPHVPRELRADVLPDYLALGYVPTPDTFFAGIHSVPPGHVLVAGTNGDVRLERYWAPRWPGADGVVRAGGGPAEQVAEVRRLLRAAVGRRLIADVPLGAFLSGGIDSSAIVGLMSELQSSPVKTFTIGFEGDDGFDERPFARAVAERHGTEHTEFVVKPDAAGLLERLVWHHDQPFGDSSALPTYLLSELTSRHVTVALCGDGGDELFAGYERFAAALALARYERAVPRRARAAVARRAAAARS
ncbi:MAG: asparagine synthase (glutamine-hydrolyzing), partial [Solirubrobacteraceae bacterium]|nr:asparagine synthase (glutamine-hydrolyzing) [Solirubrobacteraceae bacterium]